MLLSSQAVLTVAPSKEMRASSEASVKTATCSKRATWEDLSPCTWTNHVYDFSEGAELGRELLGGKGAGLAQMTAIGIPVPAGFTVTTAACIEYMQNGRKLPRGLDRTRSRRISRRSRRQPGSASATRKIRCSSRCARARRSRCPG